MQTGNGRKVGEVGMTGYNALNIHVDYDSPLIISYVEQMATDIAKFTDDGVMKAVVKAGFDIDKHKLVQILEQDKERYSEAYRKGFAEGYKKRDDEIVRCRDCKHCYFADNRIPSEQGYVCGRNGIDVTPDWYCADGERKEEDE